MNGFKYKYVDTTLLWMLYNTYFVLPKYYEYVLKRVSFKIYITISNILRHFLQAWNCKHGKM